jgi:hypothetical protein
MKQFSIHLYEAKGNWTMPDDASIRKEYQIEYKKHLIHELDHDIFPTENSFVKAVKASKTMVVTPNIDSEIAYRSRTRSMKDLLRLIKGYRSYPKFRNEKTLTDLESRIVNGKPTDMPMVVKFPHGGMRVFAGNTRMDIAFMHGINPTVIVIDLAKHMNESVVSEAIHGTADKKNTWYKMSGSEVRGNKDIQKDIYDIIRQAYSTMGGHPDFPSVSSVPHDNDKINVIDTDAEDDVDATILSKTTVHGKKVTALASDGSTDAKKALLTRAVELLNKEGNYLEASEKVLEILVAKGAKVVTNRKTVERVLSGKQIEWHGKHPKGLAGDGWYSRMIGSAMKTKRMLGNPRV